MLNSFLRFWSVVLLCGGLLSIATADEKHAIQMGKLTFEAPKNFERQQPRSEIIMHEFSIPPAEGDARPGRMTVTTSGGSVQQNIDRWIGQFAQPDGSDTRKNGKIEETEIRGHAVHFVELSGTFDDKPAPFAPGQKRENYRMLGAIIPTAEGTIYFKLYGPRKTVSESQEAFRDMIVSGLKQK